MIEVTVEKIGIDLWANEPVVVLKDKKRNRFLPIIIGPFEATAIALAMENMSIPRPMTHTLITTIITKLKAHLLRIEVRSLTNNVYNAVLVLHKDDEMIEVDTRPSDGIVIALKLGKPILVSEKVMDQESIMDDQGYKKEEEEKKKKREFKRFLDNVKPSDFSKPEDKS